MKKLYFIAALAAIGLASCTSEEEVRTEQAPQQIALKAVTKKATRSAVIGGDLPTSTPLYVTIYHRGDEIPGDPFHIFVDDRTFLWAAGCYTSNPIATTYPGDGGISAIAYTSSNYTVSKVQEGKYKSEFSTSGATIKPTNVSTGYVKVEDKYYINSLILPFGNQLAGQTDVMYSEPYDIEDVNASNVQTTVHSLTLRHALAWLKVNFSAASNITDEIIIRNVKVNNTYLTGTIKVSFTKSGNTYTSEVEAEPNGTASSTEFEAYSTIQGAGTASDATLQGLLVLPQDQQTITFEYCKKSPEYNGTYNPSVTEGRMPGYSAWKTFEIKPGADAKWVAGNLYEYDVTIASGEQIRFKCNVTGWGSGTTPSTTVDPDVIPTVA